MTSILDNTICLHSNIEFLTPLCSIVGSVNNSTVKALLHYAFFHWRFSRAYPRVYDTNMLVSNTRVKTQEKWKESARKIKKASPTREIFSILHYALGKNASKLRFSRVMLAFCLRFACVLLAFCCVLLTNLTKTQTQRIV